MAFRRIATAASAPSRRSTTEDSLPNPNPSSSPTRPLLVEGETGTMEDRSPSNEALVENDGLSSSPYLNAATFEPTADELEELKRSQQKWNLVVFSIGSAAFLFACLAILWETAFVTVVAFVFPLVLGPYMIRQRRQLNRIPTLRRLINRTRFQVNRLSVQNNKFGAENTRLEGETDRLKSIQFQLHQVCQTQGTNIDELQTLIREHGTIMKEMNRIQDAAELQDLLQTILLSDTDGDFHLSDEEFHRFSIRLKCFSVVDEERLKQALRMSSTGSDKYKLHATEADLEIKSRGALSGLDGWMV